MINALDETLAKLLSTSLPQEWAGQVQISFAAPDAQFPPQSVTPPAIDLFLYDIRENLDLRSNEIQVTRGSDGTVLQRRAPVRVDFSYLVTAWPSESVTAPWEDEHRLLGEVMRVLLRHRTIPQAVLQGELAGQDLPQPVSSLQPARLQSHGEFWQAMGGKPKAALNYMVTLSVEVSVGEHLHLVTDKLLDVGLMKRVSAGEVGPP
jgi:hypothetical protein